MSSLVARLHFCELVVGCIRHGGGDGWNFFLAICQILRVNPCTRARRCQTRFLCIFRYSIGSERTLGSCAQSFSGCADGGITTWAVFLHRSLMNLGPTVYRGSRFENRVLSESLPKWRKSFAHTSMIQRGRSHPTHCG